MQLEKNSACFSDRPKPFPVNMKEICREQILYYMSRLLMEECKYFQVRLTSLGGLHIYLKISLLIWWLDDLQLLCLFNSISVISGQLADDNERLHALEPHLQLKRSSPQVGLELTTTRSVGQRLTYWARGLFAILLHVLLFFFLSNNMDLSTFKSGTAKSDINPFALRRAKTQWRFGHSECNRVNRTVSRLTLNSFQLKQWFNISHPRVKIVLNSSTLLTV